MQQPWGIQHPTYNGVAINYIKRVLLTNPIRFWPLNDTSGVSATELVVGDNGVVTGITWGQPGIGDGETSAFFDGVNDYVNIDTSALNTDFGRNECSVMVWAKVANAGVWTDGVLRRSFAVVIDASNFIIFAKDSLNNIITITQRGGGVQKSEAIITSSTDFLCLGCSWSVASDEIKFFMNGTQQGTTKNSVQPLAGNIVDAVIGARSAAPSNPWYGTIGHVAIWNRAISTTEWLKLYDGV